MAQVQSSWWGGSLFSSSPDPPVTTTTTVSTAVTPGKVAAADASGTTSFAYPTELQVDEALRKETGRALQIIEAGMVERERAADAFLQGFHANVAQDATSSTRGDSTASQSTASCWSSKTPTTEAELPAMTASLATGARGTAPGSAEEGQGLAANSFGNFRSKPLLPVPRETQQDASAYITAPLMASAVQPPPSIVPPGTPGPMAPPPSPIGEDVLGSPAPELNGLGHKHLVLPQGPDPASKLGPHTVYAPSSAAAAKTSAAIVPQLHAYTEFLQVVIEKQDEVGRFARASDEVLSQQTLTQMQFMKSELDRLSVSIGSVLGKSSQSTACVVAPPPGSQAGAYAAGGSQVHSHEEARREEAARWAAENLRATDMEQCVEQMTWERYGSVPGTVPIVDGVPAGPYPTEATATATAPAPAVYHSGHALLEPPPAPPVAATYPEGPAIFQGFHSPPKYAWGRLSIDGQEKAEEPVSPEKPAATQSTVQQPAEQQQAPASPPMPQPVRAKTIDTTSPAPARSPESTMRQAFSAAMEELHRCQNKCKQLRMEKRGVPAEDVELWCGSITSQLQAIGSRFEEKLEAHRVKSRAKDDTIKRLHKRLQAAEQATSELFILPSASPCQSSPATAGRRGLLSHDSSTQQITPRLAAMSQDSNGADAAGMLDTGTSPVALRTPRITGPGEPGILAETDVTISMQGNITEEAAMLTWPPGGPESQMLHRARGRFQGGDGETSLARLGIQAVGGGGLEGGATPNITPPMGSPTSTTTTRASSSTQHFAEDKGTAQRGSRRLADTASQKRLDRPGGNPPQMLRRSTTDVANPRRRDMDLTCQLQAKQQQVEQLQAQLREVQLVTSRQIGLYKRQLQLKEHSLQAMQEEWMLDRGQQVPGTVAASAISNLGSTASAASNSEGAGRGSRKHCVQVPSAGGGLMASSSTGSTGLGHSGSERRTGRGGGTTPRPGEGERGRPMQATNATWPAPVKKDPRERSLGALPTSPRSKHRDVVGQPQAAEGASRRRQSPPGPALGRSTSADERGPRRREDAEPPRQQPTGAKVYRTRDSGAATARGAAQRR